MQMFTADELRQIHEERIAPFIKNTGKGSLKSEKKNSNIRSWVFSLLNLFR